MKMLKKILVFNIILVILISFNSKYINVSSNISTRPAKVGVLLYSFDYLYLSSLRQELENIQKENPDKVKFTFFDSKANTGIQLENMNNMIQNNFDLLIFSIYEIREEKIDDIIFKAKQKNLPLIFFGSTIVESNDFKAYDKALSMAGDFKEAGVTEGKILVDLWNTNKGVIDKNNDNILQYILLRGYADNKGDIDRATNSIDAINNSGIKTQQIASAFGRWNRELGKSIISSLFIRYGKSIEAIISTNDDMAIGAVEALQQYGYNKGDESNNIVVVGFDAIPEARALIKKGFMTGSVTNESQPSAEALYAVGMNLVSGKNPTEGTNLKINGKNINIPVPYEPYTINSTS